MVDYIIENKSFNTVNHNVLKSGYFKILWSKITQPFFLKSGVVYYQTTVLPIKHE